MVTKFGNDIRYIAPWKKWIVWNGSHWEADGGGALIHTKGLEIVRNIYAEIYKTADYRERMEIEKYAIKSESTRQRENFVRVARYILELNADVDNLDRDPWLLNVENGMIDERSECRGRACTDMFLNRARRAKVPLLTERVRNRRAEPFIKQATGNDKLTARFLYGEHFNFLPTFKIFMASNYKPVIKGTDHGIWRRMKIPRSKLRGIFVGEEIYYIGGDSPAFQSSWFPSPR